MHPHKENARLMTGGQIPKTVLADSAEHNSETLTYQARHLAATFGMLPETASVIAFLAFHGGRHP